MKSYKDMYDEARLEFAASQAREKVLRDALDLVLCTHDYVADDGRQAAKRALALLELPTDVSALKAALKAQRERCIDAGFSLRDHYIDTHTEKEQVLLLAAVSDYQQAIRALGDN